MNNLESGDIEELLEELTALSDDELEETLRSLPEPVVAALQALLLASDGRRSTVLPETPLEHAREVEPKYRDRIHLRYLSDRLAQAVRDVENGQNRMLAISMPPRSGKSTLSSVNLPAWLLRLHPDWKMGLMSHSPHLATAWGRAVRRAVEDHSEEWNVYISKDAGAASDWETTDKGEIHSRSMPGQSPTGLGFKVLIIDDVVKDFSSAHSELQRERIWNAWISDYFSRLEPPYLVLFIGTRWHEDDFIGRLLSNEYEGDPSDIEVIKFPAIAEEHDVLGRKPGEPLLSPLVEETEQEALERWEKVRRTVGAYSWAALYQQRPSPAKGAIFDMDWWRYWTLDPDLASRTADGELDPNGEVVLLTREQLERGSWSDSWDLAFKGTDSSDFVVGQRWVETGRYRVLVNQVRKRMGFARTLEEMLLWAGLPVEENASPSAVAEARAKAPWGWKRVHERIVEEKANGPAIIEQLRTRLSAVVAINPKDSKQARAYAVTPQLEAGDVLIPLPSEASWVGEYLEEFRAFPTGANDDQVDATTQYLNRRKAVGEAKITVPGQSRSRVAVPGVTALTRTKAMHTGARRLRG